MWEKLLLAAILTFTLSLFAQISRSSPLKATKTIGLDKQGVFTVAEIY